jgi:hypothetical protein
MRTLVAVKAALAPDSALAVNDQLQGWNGTVRDEEAKHQCGRS